MKELAEMREEWRGDEGASVLEAKLDQIDAQLREWNQTYRNLATAASTSLSEYLMMIGVNEEERKGESEGDMKVGEMLEGMKDQKTKHFMASEYASLRS